MIIPELLEEIREGLTGKSPEDKQHTDATSRLHVGDKVVYLVRGDFQHGLKWARILRLHAGSLEGSPWATYPIFADIRFIKDKHEKDNIPLPLLSRTMPVDEALTGKSEEDKAETRKRIQPQYHIMDWDNDGTDEWCTDIQTAKQHAKKLMDDGYENLRIYKDLFDVVNDEKVDEDDLIWSYDAAEDNKERALKFLDELTEAFAGKSDEDKEETERRRNALRGFWEELDRNLGKSLTDKASGLRFDDWTLNEWSAIQDGSKIVWSQICEHHANEIGLIIDNEDACGAETICGVDGCDMEAEVYYDFDPTEELDEALTGKSEEDKEATRDATPHVGDWVSDSYYGRGIIKKVFRDVVQIEWDRHDEIINRQFHELAYDGKTQSGNRWWRVNEALTGKSEEDKAATQQEREVMLDWADKGPELAQEISRLLGRENVEGNEYFGKWDFDTVEGGTIRFIMDVNGNGYLSMAVTMYSPAGRELQHGESLFAPYETPEQAVEIMKDIVKSEATKVAEAFAGKSEEDKEETVRQQKVAAEKERRRIEKQREREARQAREEQAREYAAMHTSREEVEREFGFRLPEPQEGLEVVIQWRASPRAYHATWPSGRAEGIYRVAIVNPRLPHYSSNNRGYIQELWRSPYCTRAYKGGKHGYQQQYEKAIKIAGAMVGMGWPQVHN